LTIRKVHSALIALGANLSFGKLSLSEALLSAAKALSSNFVTICQVSRLYSTPCFPPGAGPDYVNAAARIETSLDPAALLAHLHRIEADFGRARLVRWGQRTLDLDLLAMDDLVLPDAPTQDQWRNLTPDLQAQLAPKGLILPHPRVQDRAFVLVPLADVAPDWRHPRLGLTVAEMLARLETAEVASVIPL
jgi:2-amino-4-hydroxy-6-hydroxymethyldihydropteridine diphosphokinase